MYPAPDNNPLAIEQYNSINPTDIKSGGYSLQNIITRQLDRVNFLLTFGTSKIGMKDSTFDELQTASAVKRGLRSVESFLSPYLAEDQEYQERVTKLKDYLASKPTAQGLNEYFDQLANWEDLLISRLGNIDLLPQKRKEVEFE